MTWVKAWLASVWVWLVSLFGRPYRLISVEGRYPTRIEPRRVYVLTEDGTPWEARMICPCGCKAVLDLNLLPDDPPSWRIKADQRGRATLHPSVWRKIECKAHFILRDGQIRWC